MKLYQAAALCFILLASCNSQQPEPADKRTVEVATTSGVTTGTESTPGVMFWPDIPYAQAPVGELRWRAPRALESSERVIPERKSGAICLQKASTTAGLAGDDLVGSEDCLYLDIRGPVAPSSKPRAVMVWIHGGANTTGYKGNYDFSTLVAREGVIVITLNYRLGVLGWFTHPAIQRGQSGLDLASNFGTLDIIQALRWIGDNVERFGGNPDNITVFGESAGGHNIYALLASPLAEGLFHRAIVQSGYMASANLKNAFNQDGENQTIARGGWQLEQALFPTGQSANPRLEVNAEALRSVSGEELLTAYQNLPEGTYTPLTTADDVVIPKIGMLDSLADPRYAKGIPVISGSNKDEVTLWLGLHRYYVDTSYLFTRWLPPRITLHDPDLYRYWVEVRSHAWKLRGVDEPLAALEAAGYNSLYAYRFDWDDQVSSFFADFPTIIGAAHGTDISFVTGDYRYGPISDYVYPEGPLRDQMEQTMMRAWANFARGGTPGNAGSTHWDSYSVASPAFMVLDIDKNLALATEAKTLASLLADVDKTPLLSSLQKCLLVWDSLTKVGEPDYTSYHRWNEGQCTDTNAALEQDRIDAQLREEHGSETVF
ncbi:MAG: para-nitrobenzyl esterase [Halieaceae bacterium]|jgi:para-nitrobenzyl esterase